MNFQRLLTRSAGFTLVEMLVALAIFAVLSLTGWKVFDALNKVKARNQIHAEQLSVIQNTYSQLLRDLSQISARPVRTPQGIEPALMIEANKLVFTRTAGFDPLKRSNGLERITYSYDPAQKKLLRYSFANPDQATTITTPATVLITDVDSFAIKALDPGESATWPSSQLAENDPLQKLGDNRLPAGIAIDIVVQQQPVNWRFSLIKTLPRSLTIGNIPSPAGATTSTPTTAPPANVQGSGDDH